MEAQDISIYVFTHKVFNDYPNNKSYKIVLLDDNKEDNGLEKIVCNKDKDNIFKKEHAYSEGARLHYIWKNIELPKYIGTAHYRRYFDFYDDIPDLDEVFKEYDAILPKFNLGWPSVYKQYEISHNIEDYNHIIKIIARDFPDYYEAAKYVSEHSLFYPCNMFILPRDTFLKYCQFVFGVLEIYDKEMGFNCDLDVYNHVVNNLGKYCDGKGNPNAYTWYQSRIQAFLMERLSTIFFKKEIKKPLLKDIVIKDIKYDFESIWFKPYK